MQITLKVLLATSILVGCSSNPEPTEAEADTTSTATATATADIAPQPTADTTGTAATTTTAPPAPAPEPAADIAVLPMKITVDAKTTMETKADKGVYFKGKKIASFEKNVLQLTEMKDNIAVMKDGTIVMTPSSPKTMRFNDKDEVEIEGGGKIAIDDKGKVTLTMPEAKDPTKAPKPVIAGFKPEARRAATLGLILALSSMSEEVKPGAGAGASATAQPAKTATPPGTATAAPKK